MHGGRTIGRQPRGRVGWSLLASAALCVAACGDSDDGASGEVQYEVTRTVVSHETTQDMLVFAPDGEGPWPVVFAMHGINGTAEHMAETSRRLAEHGLLVFAANYRSPVSAAEDLVCGFSYASDIAPDHGGDMDLPVTILGWSLGATFALEGGLTPVDPADQIPDCPVDTEAIDVVVALAGCHYAFEGEQWGFDSSEGSNHDANIVMAVGEDDQVCEAWQTEDASADLRSNGYDVEYVEFADADHFSPVFHEIVDGELVFDDHPAGHQFVDVVVEAIDARADRLAG